MSSNTGLVLADVAWARPENLGDVCDAILGYSGPAFPGLDWIRHWGKPFLLGYESSTTRAYAGGDAGAEDARQLIDVARTLPGYIESNCGVWFCAADANTTPAWALPAITEYGRRFVLELLAIGWRPTITLPYGNRDASNAGVLGALATGMASAMWGVGTWGFGEGGGAFQLPGDSDAAVVQSGNTAGPADGTDLDGLYRPLAELGFYGGPTAQPATAPTIGDDMEMFASPTRCFVAAQGTWVESFDAGPAVHRVNGIPTTAAAFLGANPIPATNLHLALSEDQYDRVAAGLGNQVKSDLAAMVAKVGAPAPMTDAQVKELAKVLATAIPSTAVDMDALAKGVATYLVASVHKAAAAL